MRGLNKPAQRINLYVNPRRTYANAPLRPMTFAWVAAAGLVAIAIGYLLLEWEVGVLEQELQDLQAQNSARTEQIEQLRAAAPSQEIDPALQAQLSGLLETRNGLQQSLDLVRREQTVGSQGFSDVFRGFARRPVKGLWLKDLQVISAGNQFLMRGETHDAALVPRLLQVLREEPAFNGRSFANVRLIRDQGEDSDFLLFELRSRVESADAG